MQRFYSSDKNSIYSGSDENSSSFESEEEVILSGSIHNDSHKNENENRDREEVVFSGTINRNNPTQMDNLDPGEVLFSGTINKLCKQSADIDKEYQIGNQFHMTAENIKPKSNCDNLGIFRENNFEYITSSPKIRGHKAIIEEKPSIKLNSKYNTIINKQSIEESSCDVCGDEYSWEDDELIICELCNYIVHQGCYGSELYNSIPKNKWYCQRCDTLIKTNLDLKKFKCFLCPESTGIMKKVDNKWFHIDCVNWTPEIYFEDDLKTRIYLKALNNERFQSLKCKICEKKEGSCIQCDYKDCKISFHVRCAKQIGLIGPWAEMEKYQNE